jgi:hypothetical protein
MMKVADHLESDALGGGEESHRRTIALFGLRCRRTIS